MTTILWGLVLVLLLVLLLSIELLVLLLLVLRVMGFVKDLLPMEALMALCGDNCCTDSIRSSDGGIRNAGSAALRDLLLKVFGVVVDGPAVWVTTINTCHVIRIHPRVRAGGGDGGGDRVADDIWWRWGQHWEHKDFPIAPNWADNHQIGVHVVTEVTLWPCCRDI